MFDPNTFAPFYEENSVSLLRYVRSFVATREDAEDICSKVWLLFTERKDSFLDEVNPVGWLFKAARNRVRQFYSGTGSERVYPSLDDPKMEQQAIDHRDVWSEQDIRDATLMTAIEGLPKAQRTAILKTFFFADTDEKKAPLTGAERAAISRAYENLREALPSWMKDDV